MRYVALSLPLLFGCSADDSASDAGSTAVISDSADAAGSGDDSVEDTGACDPGSPGCSCGPSGMCLDPLICVADICAWPPDPDGGEDDSAEDADADGGETSGPGDDGSPATCNDNDDCALQRACSVDGVCEDARDLAYEIRVPTWAPSTCDGGVVDGDADLYWSLMLGTVELGSSDWEQGGCPGSWPTDTVCVPASGLNGAWFLGLWDEDGDEDALVDALWWDDDADTVPDPIRAYILHDGVWDGTTANGGDLRVEFTVVAGCN